MQKGLGVIYVLIGVLIIAAVAGGAYYVGSKKAPISVTKNPVSIPQTPQPTSSSTDKTANWKTYTNTKLKFSFSYPNTYKFEKEDNERATFSGIFQLGDQVILSELIVNFQPTLDLKALKSCKDIQFEDNVTTCIDEKVITKNVNGIQMNVFHIMTGSKNSQVATSYVYQIINNPKIEFIHKVLGGGVVARVDQILSTFKFTQ